MKIYDLIRKNRSVRRFDSSVSIGRDFLISLIDLARLSSSARNRQPYKYYIVHTPEVCEKIFPLCQWAGYLKDWEGPSVDERPTAYIIQLLDLSLSSQPGSDVGIPLQSILLGATEKDLAGCIIGAFSKDSLLDVLSLSKSHFLPTHIIALGKPIEEVRIDSVHDGSIEYWRDAQGVHHVPKRDLNDLLINCTI